MYRVAVVLATVAVVGFGVEWTCFRTKHRCFHVRYESRLTWQFAQQSCRDLLNADLATVYNFEEDNFLHQLYLKRNRQTQANSDWMDEDEDEDEDNHFGFWIGLYNVSSAINTGLWSSGANSAYRNPTRIVGLRDHACTIAKEYGGLWVWANAPCKNQSDSITIYGAPVCELNVGATLPPAIAPYTVDLDVSVGGVDNNSAWTCSESGRCFQILNKEPTTWSEARAACRKLHDADLASIENAEDNGQIAQLGRTLKIEAMWIGLHNVTTNRSSGVWSDSSRSTYRNWNTGEPNDYHGDGSEDCVQMWSGFATPRCPVKEIATGTWNDMTCDSRYMQFTGGRDCGIFPVCSKSITDTALASTVSAETETASGGRASTSANAGLTVLYILIAGGIILALCAVIYMRRVQIVHAVARILANRNPKEHTGDVIDDDGTFGYSALRDDESSGGGSRPSVP